MRGAGDPSLSNRWRRTPVSGRATSDGSRQGARHASAQCDRVRAQAGENLVRARDPGEDSRATVSPCRAGGVGALVLVPPLEVVFRIAGAALPGAEPRELACGMLVLAGAETREIRLAIGAEALAPGGQRLLLPAGDYEARFVQDHGFYEARKGRSMPARWSVGGGTREVVLDAGELGALEIELLDVDATPWTGRFGAELVLLRPERAWRGRHGLVFREDPYRHHVFAPLLPSGRYRVELLVPFVGLVPPFGVDDPPRQLAFEVDVLAGATARAVLQRL